MNLFKYIICFICLSLLSVNTNAEVHRNYTFGTKIDIPSAWSKTMKEDGVDIVYDFYSPDQNLSIQMRLSILEESIGLDEMVQIYESNVLPQGTQRELLKEHTSVKGIPGKNGVYIVKHNNLELAVSIFYVKKKEKCYILSAIVPVSLLESRSTELKQITQSFEIDGFHTESATPNNTANTSSIGTAFFRSYSLSDPNLSQKLDQDMATGVTPVGMNISNGQMQIMYLNQDLFNITAYAIDWYVDAQSINNGVTNKMQNEGYFPMGIGSDQSKMYFLYIKGETNALAWQLVESPQDLQQVSQNIDPYLKDNYLPLGITIYAGYYYTLLIKVDEVVFKSWEIVGYQSEAAMKADIRSKIGQQKMPFAFLESNGIYNVLYVGL